MGADVSGPLFDGRAEAAIKACSDDAERTLAQTAWNELQQRMASTFRQRTGHYESHVVTDRQVGSTVVHDGGMVYGPWLEGTGSRNVSTRFKGYHIWRTVKQEMDGKADRIADEVLQKYLGRMQ